VKEELEMQRSILGFLGLAVVSALLLAKPVWGAEQQADIDPDTGLRELPYEVNSDPARYAHTGPVLIRNVNVIDGTGALPLENRDVLVEDGRIKKIVRGGSMTAPESAEVIDGRGKTLFPGLIDLHVHFNGVDRFTGSIVSDPAMISDVYRYKTYLYGFLYSGVTSVLDVGTFPQVGVGIKRLVSNDYVLGPRYFWSGPIVEGGVDPSFIGAYILNLPTSAQIPDTLDYLEGLGVDMVKLYRRTPIWMIERISAAAHERGLRVVVDSWERNNFGYLQKIGRVDGSAHLNFHFPITDQDAAELAKANHFVITTFYALNAFSGRITEDNPNYFDSPLIADVLPPEYLALAKDGGKDPFHGPRSQVHHHVVEPIADLMGVDPAQSPQEIMKEMSRIGGRNMRKLLDAGVLVGAGTDGGQGESMLVELELMIEDAGVTPLEAIKIATQNGAKILGVEDQLGTVEEGKIADLVIVEGDPAKDIQAMRNIRYVLKDGKIIDRTSLTRQWGY